MRLYVPLTADEFDRLLAFAHAERRRPQDEAAVLLAHALRGDAPAYTGLAPRAPVSPGLPSDTRSSTVVGSGRSGDEHTDRSPTSAWQAHDNGDPAATVGGRQIRVNSPETPVRE